MEEILIKQLTLRIAKELPINTTSSGKSDFQERQQRVLQEENEAALVRLCSTKLDTVAAALCEHVDSVSSHAATTEEQQGKVVLSLVYLMDLMGKCLTFRWDHIKSQLHKVEDELSEDERIRLKEKQEHILPPPLEEALAAGMLVQVTNFLQRPLAGQWSERLRTKAGIVLFQLSASNYDTVFSNILSQINSPSKSSDEEETKYMLLEYLNVNNKRLAELLDKLSRSTQMFKKTTVQMAIARVLRKAVWNWIDHYPMQFVHLCQSGTRLDGNPDHLFDVFDGWANTTAKKAMFWPLQTMLLILCPDVMLEISLNEKNVSSKEAALKGKFLEQLKTSLASSKLADIAAICYVDVCKASTYVSKSDMSALRYIVPAIEAEMQARLFNPSQPIKDSKGNVDTGLMVKCLVALYRINPRKTMNALFLDCLKVESPPYFKDVLVRGLLTIAREADQLPWNPPISDIYSSHSGNIRALFQEYVQQSKGFSLDFRPSGGDKKYRHQMERMLVDIEILTNIIRLFRADPLLPLQSTKSSQQDLDDIRKVITGLCQCASRFDIPALSEQAITTLIELHKPDNIEKWAPNDPVNGFWTISAHVNNAFADVLFSKRDLYRSEVFRMVSCIEEILGRRNEFLQRFKDKRPGRIAAELRLQSVTRLETALLIYLPSGSPQICSKCCNCFGILCDTIDIVSGGSLEDKGNSIVVNYTVYRALASQGVLTTGRAAQQKSIQRILRRVDVRTAGNFGAWDECFLRWTAFTQAVLDESQDRPPHAHKVDAKRKVASQNSPSERVPGLANEDLFQEWTNYSGFLCALSAVTHDVAKIAKVAAAKGKSVDRKVQVIDDYFSQMLALVVCGENPGVNQSARTLLATSSAPASYPYLFRLLLVETKSVFGGAGQAMFTAHSTLLVDQTITIIKLILELDAHSADDLAALPDFEELVLLLLRFVQQLVPSLKSMQTKVKMCALFEAVMQKRHMLSFKEEFQFRQTLVESVLEWTSEFAAKINMRGTGTISGIAGGVGAGGGGGGAAGVGDGSDGGDGGVDLKQLNKVTMDLDLGCLKAISQLLRGLQLQGDNDEQKAGSFSKYFTFFTRLLTRCKMDATRVHLQLPGTTVLALSYLVSANIEHGLEYFLTMGYHEDHETRSAFLNVLTNILRQGAEFDDGTEDQADMYYKLVELVIDPALEAVLALCDSVEITTADRVAMLLVNIFEANEVAMRLLKGAILAEINSTESANTLFRRNSMATKLMTAYCKMAGGKFLKECLGPTLTYLNSAKLSFECDPAKLPAGESRETNLANVERISQRFLDEIRKCIPRCPRPFRMICNFLQTEIRKKFPGSESIAIGGFIFLRFLCPGIVAPEGFKLLAVVKDQSLRRGLILITKTLQNLSNKQIFQKEPYMHDMNRFIEANIPVISQTFEEFARIPDDAPSAPAVHFSDEEKEADLGQLHYVLSENMEKVAKVLTASQRMRHRSAKARGGGHREKAGSGLEPYRGSQLMAGSFIGGGGQVKDGSDPKKRRAPTLDRLNAILAQLGTPPELTTSSSASSVSMRVDSRGKGANVHYEKFLARMNNRNTDKVKEKHVYFHQGKTRNGRPVLYYIARNFKHDVDQDLLVYHILKTTQPFWNKPYVVVVDVTLFGHEHQIGMPWCTTLSKVLPQLASDNLERVMIVNPNTWFKKFAKRAAKLAHGVRKKIVLMSSVNQVSDYITPEESALPNYTLQVDNDVKATFSPVTKTTQYNKKEVIVRISTDLLQVLYVKPYSLLGQNGALLDLFHISRIHECTASDEGQSVTVNYEWNGQKSMSLKTGSSSTTEQVLQQLKASKDRYNLSRPKVKDEARSFRPSDVPGTLLNMALLNLGSARNNLRAAAYNLLNALCTTFSFSVRFKLLEANNICIPRNCAQFVVALSDNLAASEPNITLEFLLDALHGMNKTDRGGKHLCLTYMQPWIYNLRLFCQPSSSSERADKVEKTKDLISALIDFTVGEAVQMGPAILSMIWCTMGEVPETLDVVMDALMVMAAKPKGQIGTPTMEILEDIVVSMGSRNPQLVSGKIISRVLNLLANTPNKAKDSMCDLPVWRVISVHMRFLLMLSFDNMIYVQQYLPELLHIVMMTFSTGKNVIRATIHGMLINIVHSLFTSSSAADAQMALNAPADATMNEYSIDAENSRTQLRFLLNEFHQPSFRLLFGIRGKVTAFSRTRDTSQGDRLPIHAADTVAAQLLQVLHSVSPINMAFGTAYHARWLSLTAATAFTPNLALQQRAFMVLGVLSQSPEFITEQLVSQAVAALRLGLKTNNEELAVAVVSCLARMFEHVPSTSRYFHPMFWISVTMLQIGSQSVFTVALTLLEVVLKRFDENQCFKEHGLAGFCMGIREGELEPMLDKLDEVTGISFKTNFAFAVAAHLLKGLRQSSNLRLATARLLSIFVDIAAKDYVGSNMLGYLAALLPFKGGEMAHLRQILLPAGEGGPHQYFFTEHMLPDTQHGALLFSFLAAVLKNSESDEVVQLFVYNALKEGVLIMPEAFPVTYDIVIPKMTQVLTTCHNAEIVEAVLSIMKSMFSSQVERSNQSNKLHKTYLSKIGFEGLPACDSFPPARGSAGGGGVPLSKTQGNKTEDTKGIACGLLDVVV